VTKSDSTGSGEYHSLRDTATKKSNDRPPWLIDLSAAEPAQHSTISYRYLIPSGEIAERPNDTFNTDSGTESEITSALDGDYFILTNDPAMAPEAEDSEGE